MKRSMAVCLVVAVTLMVSGVAMAKKPAPPTITGNVINVCYKAVNGQLRVVSGPSDCLPSELPLSWAQSAPAASAISGTVGTISGSVIQWVFAGPTATVTTLAAQKISGVANAQLGIIAGAGSFDYDLCYAADGSTTLVNFAGVNSATGAVSVESGQISFAAAGSVVPGAGTWQVGFCVLNAGVAALTDNNVVNGWVIVTQ
jgi:hypothetical protein